MKKFDGYKSVQLIIYAALTVLIIINILMDSDISQAVAIDPKLKIMRSAICFLLALAFFFLFLDITIEAKRISRYSKIDLKSRSDSIGHIANRNSIDEMIKKYWDEPLPDRMCCIMMVLTSLVRANDRHTRKGGDRQIMAFSLMMSKASLGNCFVGRNGGNVFLAIYESGKKQEFSDFLDRMEAQVKEYNDENPDSWIRYKFGIAYNKTENVEDISELISIAHDKSIHAEIRPDENGEFKTYSHYR